MCRGTWRGDELEQGGKGNGQPLYEQILGVILFSCLAGSQRGAVSKAARSRGEQGRDGAHLWVLGSGS